MTLPDIHPTVDVLNDAAAVIIQERPLVSLSPWLNDAIKTCAESSRELQIVTPTTTRITYPLETFLATRGARWVVRSADGSTYFDGLRGEPLEFDGARFAAVEGEPPADFLDVVEPTGGSVRIDQTVLHTASSTLRLGAAIEETFLALTGAGPRGWGIAEPVTQPWDAGALTELARDRAPKRTILVVVGGRPESPALGLVSVRVTNVGVHERLRLAVASASPPDLDAVDALAGRLADRHVVRTVLAGLRPGPADGTIPPRYAGTVLPYGILIGPEGVGERGIAHAAGAPAPDVRILGPEGRPSVWAGLVRRGDPTAEADPVRALADVMRHFAGR